MLAAAVAFAPVPARADEPLVFAAASLKNALDDVIAAYAASGGGNVRVSYAGSSVLARQIEAGAGADLFISADTGWMDYLARHGLIDDASRETLLGNQLVLIAPRASAASLVIGRNFPLRAALGAGRLAIADPDSVPAGKYARASLMSLGVWDDVAGRTANAENVRLALLYVARGEAPFGIVYATDALQEPRVRVVGTFPEGSHPPIVYPVALTKGARPQAVAFLKFLGSAKAQAAFRNAGFTCLAPAAKP
jgi:molybdate transport system substrate-binding protein